MPDEVFMRVFTVHNNKTANKNRDDYKPQYLNFLSPLSIKLFLRTINKVDDGFISIEEMLPNSIELNEIDNDKYVMETIVQWSHHL